MIKEIPLRARDAEASYGDPYTRTYVELLGATYTMDARWNEDESAWFLDVFEEDNTPIRVGLKLVLGLPIGWRTNDERFPGKDPENPGVLILSDLSGQNKDMEFADLGDRVRLYFVPLEDIELIDDVTVPDPPPTVIEGAPLDGPSLVYVPKTVEHWAALNIPPPTIQVSTQVASGNLTAIIGSDNMATIGTGHSYQHNVTGWDHYSVRKPDAQDGAWQFASPILDLSATENFGALIYFAGQFTSGAYFMRFYSANQEFEWGASTGVQFDWDANSFTETAETTDTDIIRPYWMFRDGGATNLAYASCLAGSGTIADSSGALSGNVTTRNIAAGEATYGPIMAFWSGTDADAILSAGLHDESMLKALRWTLEF